jgi:hypothetical protein
MSIEKWARIRRTDNQPAKILKIFHIANEMRRNNMKIKAIQWLFKEINKILLKVDGKQVNEPFDKIVEMCETTLKGNQNENNKN